MALSLAPFGLRSARNKGSGANSKGYSTYNINPAGFAGNIFSGDAVNIPVGGYVAPVSANAANALGAFMGCRYNDPTTKRPTWSMYYPANTSVGTDPFGIQAFVDDNTNGTWLVQAGASVSAGDVMAYNFALSLGAGSTVTGVSGFTLAAASRSTAAASGSPNFRIIGLYKTPDNAWSDPNAIVEVVIVNNEMTALLSVGN